MQPFGWLKDIIYVSKKYKNRKDDIYEKITIGGYGCGNASVGAVSCGYGTGQ